MRSRTVRMKALPVIGAIAVVAATVALSAASAKSHDPPGLPPDAVLTWNTYAVNAVRASTPTKVQTDCMVYMSYAQAAVYDAVAVAPAARLVGSPVRSTPALASMSTIRGLFCTTWLGAWRPATAVWWVTVPLVVTSPVAGSQVNGTSELTVAARLPLT